MKFFQFKKNVPAVLSTLSASTEMTGDLIVDESLTIKGSITGNIKSSGKLIFQEGSVFTGDIAGESMNVSGVLSGTFSLDGILGVKHGGSLTGEITPSLLFVEKGAKVNGNVHMLAVDKKIDIFSMNTEEIRNSRLK